MFWYDYLQVHLLKIFSGLKDHPHLILISYKLILFFIISIKEFLNSNTGKEYYNVEKGLLIQASKQVHLHTNNARLGKIVS